MKVLELFVSPALVQSAEGGGLYPALFAGGDRAWDKQLQRPVFCWLQKVEQLQPSSEVLEIKVISSKKNADVAG